MGANKKLTLTDILSEKNRLLVDEWIAKYPADERQSAVMAALMIVQDEKGRLTTDYMDAVAVYLNMPPIAVYEVATFYSMYKLKDYGRHCVNVCTNVSCMLADAEKLMKHFEEKLGISCGETTADGRFTLQKVECLGACVNAPVVQVNKEYHEHVTAEKADAILEHYR